MTETVAGGGELSGLGGPLEPSPSAAGGPFKIDVLIAITAPKYESIVFNQPQPEASAIE